MLEGLQGIAHRHIIRLLGSYEQGDDCHFLFPFADGDLMWLMTTQPDVWKSKEVVPWIMAQMKGICDALCKVHEQTKETTSHLGPSHQQGTGYHHDIKPQNILYFSQSRISLDGSEHGPIPGLGLLQLADFGVGKFRRVQSGTGTNTWRGTPTYAAPESLQDFEDLTRKHKISRPYDIWSFGCVLLEVLVWIVHGPDELRAFTARRSQPGHDERSDYQSDAFCCMTKSHGLQLKSEVTSCMQKLRKHHRLSNADSSLSKLLKLVQQTLKINPMDRMKAVELKKQLSRISNLAEIEPRYEFAVEKAPQNEGSVHGVPTPKSDPNVSTLEIRDPPEKGDHPEIKIQPPTG
jgi:serine/threonine protein kinase